MSSDALWWRNGVFYQVYPRSLMDSNGDGVGDLQGIIDRLDYLTDLGITAIWISPIYESPMADFGYDISDHKAVHPIFGDMETFDRLLAEAHKRDLRIVLDFVPNHTSDQHKWFIESRSSRGNPRRDWYIWKDARPGGGEPNNWIGNFGGSAWEWDEATQQYYLHLFLKEQPDVNWRNPEVVEAMHDVLRFWLDKGVDGFRADAVMFSIKDAQLRDNPPIEPNNPFKAFGVTQEPVHSQNQPEIHDLIRGLRSLCDEYPGDRVLIGETWFFDPHQLVKYYGRDLDEFHIPFNFTGTLLPWDASEVRKAVEAYYAAIPDGAVPNFVLGNHDIHRLADRFGYENHRSAGMLLLTLWGVPTMYYGDEIGMRDVEIPPDRQQDPWGINMPDIDVGRDPERTPMQWDDSANSGFSPPGVEPWLPVASDYKLVNVRTQLSDPNSTLSFYRTLLRLRRSLPALHRGGFEFVDRLREDVLGYVRSTHNQRLLVVINFGGSARTVDVRRLSGSGKVLLSTQPTEVRDVDLGQLALRPNESLVIDLK